MAQPTTTQLMQILEESATAIAAFTGMKKQFIEAGWAEHNAEQAVIAMMNAGNK